MSWLTKNLANILSIFRIFFSVSLVFLNFFEPLFLVVYFLCGLTDIFDGYIARKTSTQSPIGAKLDSVADFILFIVVFYAVITYRSFDYHVLCWVACIFFIRVISILIILVKYRTFAMLHTIGNKVTGFLLFILPFIIASSFIDFFIIVILIAAAVASIEEIVIVLKSEDLDVNIRSIVSKRNT